MGTIPPLVRVVETCHACPSQWDAWDAACRYYYLRAAGSPAPTLKGVFSRTTLVTGDQVNDENVAKQIRNGSPQMPSFGTTLKDADIADLLAYLHNGCCYEETNPPVNPWYRANAQNSPPMPERGNLRGGPKGTVRAAGGDRLEGIMVQLIAPNAVRTTVTSDRDGQYEFPQLLPASTRTPRIAIPPVCLCLSACSAPLYGE